MYKIECPYSWAGILTITKKNNVVNKLKDKKCLSCSERCCSGNLVTTYIVISLAKESQTNLLMCSHHVFLELGSLALKKRVYRIGRY